jgi:hypothetical protein
MHTTAEDAARLLFRSLVPKLPGLQAVGVSIDKQGPILSAYISRSTHLTPGMIPDEFAGFRVKISRIAPMRLAPTVGM